MKTMVMMKRKTKILMKTKMTKTIKITKTIRTIKITKTIRTTKIKTNRMTKIKMKLMMMVNKTGKMKMIHNLWLTALRHSMTSMIFNYVHTIKRELSTSTLIHLSLTMTLLLKHLNGLC